jgi:hypothetical protein
LALTLFLLPALGVASLLLYARSPYGTGQTGPVEQPVQFDHRHHTADVGIDCRYCHSSVETASTAGMPSSAVCLNCHSQIWNQSPLLDPIRASYFDGKPIAWKRVHDLPDFVYFNHAIHVTKGIGCESCHGRVDQMAAIEQVAPLTMAWCLDCHRDPTPHLRSPDFQVSPRTNCTTCHR